MLAKTAFSNSANTAEPILAAPSRWFIKSRRPSRNVEHTTKNQRANYGPRCRCGGNIHVKGIDNIFKDVRNLDIKQLQKSESYKTLNRVAHLGGYEQTKTKYNCAASFPVIFRPDMLHKCLHDLPVRLTLLLSRY